MSSPTTPAAGAGPPIPVTIVSGYLGAGKTTLVNHLLRHAGGLRLAVLVNDFGALPIDADLIEGREGNVLSIAGGCVCCSFGSDLMDALRQILHMAPRPDHILIETSGVALPASVAGAVTLLAGLALETIVVLADGETVRERARDRYIGDTIARQLAEADLVLVNKTDLVAEAALAETTAWAARMAPRAAIVPVARGAVPAPLVLAPARGGPRPGTSPAADDHHDAVHRHETSLYETLALDVPGTVDAEKLAAVLSAPTTGLLRAKGFVRAADGAELTAIQIVGNRAEVARAPPGTIGAGRLVCIGLAGHLDRSAIEAAIAQARRTRTPA